MFVVVGTVVVVPVYLDFQITNYQIQNNNVSECSVFVFWGLVRTTRTTLTHYLETFDDPFKRTSESPSPYSTRSFFVTIYFGDRGLWD